MIRVDHRPVRLGAIRPGERVGVFGCGPIGLFLIQLARASGATTIVATDVLPHRLAAARATGATATALVAGGSERADLRGHRRARRRRRLRSGRRGRFGRDLSRARCPRRHGRGRRHPLEGSNVLSCAHCPPKGPDDQIISAHEPCLSGRHPDRRGRADRRLVGRHRELPDEQSPRRPSPPQLLARG